MKARAADSPTRRRRLLVRCALLAAYAALLALVFVLGKGHTILLDNKDAGGERAVDGLVISVNGGEEIELYPGDRDKAVVMGQRHRVAVETMDGRKVERAIRLPIGQEMLLLSIPMLVAGSEPMLTPFEPLDVAPPPDESIGNTNEFISPGADPVLPAPGTPGGAPLPAVPGAR
jgi:hypothetical protein